MKDMFYFLRQIHSYAGKMLYINLLMMTFIGLFESIGLLLLIPMLSMTGLVSLDAGKTPISPLFAFLKDFPASVGLPLILGTYVFLVIGQNLLQRHITIQNATIQNGFLKHLRVETYRTLLHANWNFFIKKRKSDLINLMLTEVTRTSGATNAFLQFIASLVFTFIQIILAFCLSPAITAFVLVSGLMIVLLNRKFLKKSLELGSRNVELGKSFLSGMTDQINGIKDIKSNTLEESRMNWFHSITEKLYIEQVDYIKLKTTSQVHYKIASSILMAAFIFMVIELFNAQAAQLMLIILIFSRLWPKVAGIQSSLEQIASTIPSFKAVKALQHECRKAKEYEGTMEAIEPIPVLQGIECRYVNFRYTAKEAVPTLKDISIFLPANQMTAVVGRSGAGKSTLIDLLMGLNKPESGQVLVDGIPLSAENVLSLRKSVSYVAQDPFLFNTSIRENLQLVVPEAGEEQMWEALVFASAADFVRNLPQGLDTIIGDRGIKLSGGERQRIVLARAILRKPSILVLDEATSALDTENEARIQEAIERLKGKMTIIVIAHRLSTIRNADQVIVLEKGEVVQQGAFSQLSQEKNKVFSKLLSSQAAVIKQG
ncbi:ABC transporter ATP-binding protein/permease [Domibacillus sp. PGB-M46]|uniref:ABC transporter ATP-binding protein n=1 Tax=Domibacillus sp. PGB-M46 TaxID=2910255 RepID=UPI001F596490|nr:ABC transporter ATP-binding protein [Domibacillus sp. PGB-M46]MCI2255183.1 ABC transporter ATP-binding protein/permease [Domibacillus sp. PGB-M46]